MGFEIRRVAPDWQHPLRRDDPRYADRFRPLLSAEDLDYRLASCLAGKDDLPWADDFMPRWLEHEATCFQVYETISEGTPISPVLASLDDLEAWLVEQGQPPAAVRRFMGVGICSLGDDTLLSWATAYLAASTGPRSQREAEYDAAHPEDRPSVADSHREAAS